MPAGRTPQAGNHPKNPELDLKKLKAEYARQKYRGMSAERFSELSGVPYWTVRDWRKQLRTESVTIHIEPEVPHEAVLEMMRMSGLSMRSFSNASGIPYYTLRSWVRKSRDNGKSIVSSTRKRNAG